MITYKEVFQLAQDKGYSFRAGKPTNGGQYFDSDINEWELTLIQKWLRDEHLICVVSAPIEHPKYLYQISFLEARKAQDTGTRILNDMLEGEKRGYKCPSLSEHELKGNTYEQALTEGIYEALKLIP